MYPLSSRPWYDVVKLLIRLKDISDAVGSVAWLLRSLASAPPDGAWDGAGAIASAIGGAFGGSAGCARPTAATPTTIVAAVLRHHPRDLLTEHL